MASYKRNFLDNVIFRIDFEKINNPDNIEKFLDKLSPTFPFKSKHPGKEGTFEINLLNKELVTSEEEFISWDYLDTYKNKKLTVTPKFLIIEYLNRSYNSSAELLDDCKNIVDDFLKENSVAVINRLGLRYINRFNLDTEVQGVVLWNDYFNKNLVGSIDFTKDLSYPLSRAFNQLQMKLDDHDILMKYGIWNQDFPSENTRKEFIIDIDAFSRYSLESITEITDVIKKYNANIETIFERCIESKARELLNQSK